MIAVRGESSRAVSRNSIGVRGQGNSLGSVLALTDGKGSTAEVTVKEEEKTLQELKKMVSAVKTGIYQHLCPQCPNLQLTWEVSKRGDLPEGRRL